MKTRFLSLLLLALPLIGCQSRPPAPRTFSFGVLTDVQYANKDPSGSKHFRTSKQRLEACVGELNRHDLAFTIQLGDMIDGNETEPQTLAEFDEVLDIYNALSMPHYHVVGNHCMEAGKETLGQRLELERLYYDFTVPEAKGWRFIVLDGNDAGKGVLGKEQLAWLEKTLAAAANRKEQVIVFNHFALIRDTARYARMAEPQPVLDLIERSGCVVAYFAGHDHAGGYAVQNGIHHVTVKAMLESPEGNAFAIIEVNPDLLVETGFGEEPSRTMGRGAE
jgi:manganese-dependent ADP-ribose/CDP-alcohol diphosphatase